MKTASISSTNDKIFYARSRKRALTRRLLEWGQKHSPQYPWRKTNDPYLVLVAELLLRKTRADQVRDVYEQFIHSFPSLETLSESNAIRIYQAVRCLGLNNRHVWIKHLARQMYSQFGNMIPDNESELKTAIQAVHS